MDSTLDAAEYVSKVSILCSIESAKIITGEQIVNTKYIQLKFRILPFSIFSFWKSFSRCIFFVEGVEEIENAQLSVLLRVMIFILNKPASSSDFSNV